MIGDLSSRGDMPLSTHANMGITGLKSDVAESRPIGSTDKTLSTAGNYNKKQA